VARTKHCVLRQTSVGDFSCDLEEDVVSHVALCGSHCVI
jgi:hypothetical protein